MPALPSVPNVLRIAISGLKSARPWANILHYAFTGSLPTVANLTSLISDLSGSWNTNMKPRATSDCFLELIKATDLTNPSGAQTETAFSIQGTNAEDPLPNSACFLVDYPVSLRYRGGHPRTYIVGGGDGDLVAGGNWSTWNTSFITAMGTSWTNFSSFLTSRVYGSTTIGAQCAVRYKSGGLILPTPIVLTLPTFGTEANLATQRRRVRFSS